MFETGECPQENYTWHVPYRKMGCDCLQGGWVFTYVKCILLCGLLMYRWEPRKIHASATYACNSEGKQCPQLCPPACPCRPALPSSTFTLTSMELYLPPTPTCTSPTATPVTPWSTICLTPLRGPCSSHSCTTSTVLPACPSNWTLRILTLFMTTC